MRGRRIQTGSSKRILMSAWRIYVCSDLFSLIVSNLFLAPMVSAHSKRRIQQPPTSNVDALPNALQDKHSPSDRKILKKRVRRICCSQNEQGASVAQPRRRPDDEAGNTVFDRVGEDLV